MDRKSLIASFDILSKNFREGDVIAKDLQAMSVALSKMSDDQLSTRMASDAPSFESAVEAKVETFECPDCGTKVMKQTGYCVKCKKKVKEAAVTELPDTWSKAASMAVARSLVADVLGIVAEEDTEEEPKSEKKEEAKPVVEEKSAAKEVKPEQVEEKPPVVDKEAKKQNKEDSGESMEDADVEAAKKVVDTDVLASITFGDIDVPMGVLSNEEAGLSSEEQDRLAQLFQ